MSFYGHGKRQRRSFLRRTSNKPANNAMTAPEIIYMHSPEPPVDGSAKSVPADSDTNDKRTSTGLTKTVADTPVST